MLAPTDPTDPAASPWLLLALAVLVLVAGVALGVRLVRGATRRRLARHRRLGRRGEAKGMALLARAGWRVVETQPSARVTLLVDGSPVSFSVRADALVDGPGGRWVAEIKGGAVAARLQTAATRRQIIEYAYAFDAVGVLLVDVPARAVRRVEVRRG